MKKSLFILISFIAILFTSCSKSTGELNGEIYICDDEISYQKYEFKSNGSVYNYRRIKGSSTSFDTKGCALYYKLDGSDLTIYHGVKGWKERVRHTPFASGKYYGSYIVLDGDTYEKQ